MPGCSGGPPGATPLHPGRRTAPTASSRAARAAQPRQEGARHPQGTKIQSHRVPRSRGKAHALRRPPGPFPVYQADGLNRNIDPKLLAEAFAYAERLGRLEEREEQPEDEAPQSGLRGIKQLKKARSQGEQQVMAGPVTLNEDQQPCFMCADRGVVVGVDDAQMLVALASGGGGRALGGLAPPHPAAGRTMVHSRRASEPAMKAVASHAGRSHPSLSHGYVVGCLSSSTPSTTYSPLPAGKSAVQRKRASVTYTGGSKGQPTHNKPGAQHGAVRKPAAGSATAGKSATPPSAGAASGEMGWNSGSGERNSDRNCGLRGEEMDRLVRNFEMQTSIAELRRELEESKASMERSEGILRRAAHDFYGRCPR